LSRLNSSLKNLNAIKEMPLEDQAKLLTTSFLLSQRVDTNQVDANHANLVAVLHQLGDSFLANLQGKISYKDIYQIMLLFQQNNEEGRFFQFEIDSEKLSNHLNRVNNNSELVWFINLVWLYRSIDVTSHVNTSTLAKLDQKLAKMSKNFDLSAQYLLGPAHGIILFIALDRSLEVCNFLIIILTLYFIPPHTHTHKKTDFLKLFSVNLF
jgi:hypothetical protein